MQAAVDGAWLDGRPGEIACQRVGRRCALAMEVIAALPEAIRQYE